MNKRETILAEAKRLFGQYGYLGFTLKQLATACHMTSPALYYFYSSKADLFKDCLLSELVERKAIIERCAGRANTLPEFARIFAYDAIEVCDTSHFRAGQAMQEIIHLPVEMQEELTAAWDDAVITPVVAFLNRVLPVEASTLDRRLVATFIINLATFSSGQEDIYGRDQLSLLLVSVATGIEQSLAQP